MSWCLELRHLFQFALVDHHYFLHAPQKLFLASFEKCFCGTQQLAGEQRQQFAQHFSPFGKEETLSVTVFFLRELSNLFDAIFANHVVAWEFR